MKRHLRGKFTHRSKGRSRRHHALRKPLSRKGVQFLAWILKNYFGQKSLYYKQGTVMKKETYVATIGEYNRGFGESPSTSKEFEASSLDEAKEIAKGLIAGSNPDTFVEVKLKG
jgi:hypothetical protein